MIFRTTLGLALTVMSLALVGCDDDADPAGLGELPADPEVFSDDFPADVSFQAFDGSKLDAVSVDESVARTGGSSLKVTVPAPGDPSGSYAGGALVTTSPRSFTRYDALTFWARSSTPATLDAVGFGNDNSAEAHFVTEMAGLTLSTEWTKFVVPIPFPRMLQEEDGLFFFAESAEGSESYDIWFDDIRFEALGTVTDPRPVMPSQTLTLEVGSSTAVEDLAVTFDVDGTEMDVDAGPGYFTFFSSNRNVATVSPEGSVSVVGEGMSTITGLLSLTRVSGELTVSTSTAPTEDGPTPTQDPANVISLFSDAYDDVTVDTWSAVWDQADLEDLSIGGGAAKLYTNLVFAGIEFTSETIDATAMERFRMDIWTPDPSASSTFKIKLVDFGADGAFDGGDDTEHELSFTATSTPALETGAWVTIDVPLDDFTGMTGREHIAQLIISGDPNTVYVDNVMFYRGGPPPTEPLTAAPTPTEDPADVISLFSDAYTNETVDTWSASWDDADQADVQVEGDDAKLYSSLVFAGIEFTSAPIDATGMDRFRMDIWTPDPSADPAEFKVKLVDFGADGAFDGGDDTEDELSFTAASTPALKTGTWVTLDVPLDDFAGMTSRGNIAQLIISGDPNTVWVDNVYFYASGAPPVTEPTVAAPTPSYPASNVVSMFSDAYTDVTVDTWSASWDQADVADVQIAGNDTKAYTNLVFAGIEAGSAPIDASAMERFRMDIWTPDATTAPAEFKVKLVDFGADGAYQGGDDVEHELTFTDSSTPAVTTGSWVSIDVPLSDFTNLTTRGAIAQLVISGDPNTVYVDNVLFYTPPPSAPAAAAPTPTDDAANVVSLYSNAYMDVTVDTWSASWDQADVADVQIAGNDTKEYTNLVFAGIEAGSAPIDASSMTHFRFDLWTPDPTAAPAEFKVKLVDFGADGAYQGGDDVEHELTLTDASSPPLATGSWVSYDIPLSDFTNLTTRGAIAQLIISGDPNTVFIDNVYFRN